VPSPRPATARTSRSARHDELLDVLAELIVEQGPEHLSLPELAVRAGVSTSLVYSHFPSRAAALTELLHLVWPDEGADGVDADAAALVERYLGRVRRHGALVAELALRPSSLPEVEEVRREMRARDVGVLRAALERVGASPGHAAVSSAILDAALVEGAVLCVGDQPPEAVAPVLQVAVEQAFSAAQEDALCG
jgi:AcrR family transcriptional regulator